MSVAGEDKSPSLSDSRAPWELGILGGTADPQSPSSQGSRDIPEFHCQEVTTRKPAQSGCICMPLVLCFEEGRCSCFLCCPGPPCSRKMKMYLGVLLQMQKENLAVVCPFSPLFPLTDFDHTSIVMLHH